MNYEIQKLDAYIVETNSFSNKVGQALDSVVDFWQN